MYLTQGLQRSLQQTPDKIVTIFGARRRTFREFGERVARRLRQAGEVCFIVRERERGGGREGGEQRARILQIARQTGLHLTRVGRIDAEPGLRLHQMNGRRVCISANGFDHFAA